MQFKAALSVLSLAVALASSVAKIVESVNKGGSK